MVWLWRNISNKFCSNRFPAKTRLVCPNRPLRSEPGSSPWVNTPRKFLPCRMSYRGNGSTRITISLRRSGPRRAPGGDSACAWYPGHSHIQHWRLQPLHGTRCDTSEHDRSARLTLFSLDDPSVVSATSRRDAALKASSPATLMDHGIHDPRIGLRPHRPTRGGPARSSGLQVAASSGTADSALAG